MKKLKIGVIVQARMNSTRLYGKVLKKLYKDDTVLGVLIERLKMCKLVDQIIVATTFFSKDQPIINEVNKHDEPLVHDISLFLGSENNVLERYYYTAKKYELDIIIRLSADCPFNDPRMIDDLIRVYLDNKCEHAKNFDEKKNYVRGFDIEIFSYKVLERVYNVATEKLEKEHVTYFIYKNPNLFKIYTKEFKDLDKYNGLRLTIDYPEDLQLCREIYKRLIKNGKGIGFTINDIIEVLDNNPELVLINKDVQHKRVY